MSDLLFGFILANAVALLQLADKLIALASDHRPVAVAELPPLHAGLAHHPLPIAGDTSPIHDISCDPYWVKGHRSAQVPWGQRPSLHLEPPPLAAPFPMLPTIAVVPECVFRSIVITESGRG
jgi:hypothetical protein